jgi:FixJ family two-component response regulator
MQSEAVVHIIDDDESLREGLSSLFRSVGLTVCAHESGPTFLEKFDPSVPGCIVLDVRMPGLSGLDFQDRLMELDIGLPVILMTGHGDIPMSVRAMKAGAIDFLTKPFRDQDMLDAVTAAIERDVIVRQTTLRTSSLKSLFEKLSPRERQVMQMVTAGKMNKQVAGDLNLSEITVKIHRGSAMRKMGARTLADLVRMAEMLGLSSENSKG